jgi:hypothetical protein
MKEETLFLLQKNLVKSTRAIQIGAIMIKVRFMKWLSSLTKEFKVALLLKKVTR